MVRKNAFEKVMFCSFKQRIRSCEKYESNLNLCVHDVIASSRVSSSRFIRRFDYSRATPTYERSTAESARKCSQIQRTLNNTVIHPIQILSEAMVEK
jgi:hypothetical protein